MKPVTFNFRNPTKSLHKSVLPFIKVYGVSSVVKILNIREES